MEYFYKYRSLKDLKRFISIIMNHELYGALYTELNDPMEGVFRYRSNISHDVVNLVKSKKARTYICSLSQESNIGLMWSMYADEYNGCCIKISVTSTTWERLDINYQDNVFSADSSGNLTIQGILGTKSKQWEHEKEVRYIRTMYPVSKSRPKLSIKIDTIFLGYRISQKDFSFYKNLVRKLDPKIEVKKKSKEEINYGFLY